MGEWAALVDEVLDQYAKRYPEFGNEELPLGVRAFGVWPDSVTVPVSDRFEPVTREAIDAYAKEYGRYNYVFIWLAEASLSQIQIRVSGDTKFAAPNIFMAGTHHDLVLECRPSSGVWSCLNSGDDA
jgi:hypothetical protein